MADATNVRIGVMQAWFNGVDLGHTRGGVTVSYEPDFEDIRVDKYASIVNAALSDESLTVAINLAEPQVERLRYAILGYYETSGSNKSLNIGKDSATLASTASGILRLHPIRLANSDTSEDITIYKAFPSDEVELEFTSDDQTVVEVTFKALVDESKTEGYLGHIGPGIS